VTRFRPFRNSDPPALLKLWNRTVPESGVARPLRVHELDTHAWGTVNFDAAGLIVAEKDGRIVGYVHAGFGPDLPVASTPPLQLCHDLGSICLFVVEPDLDDAELVSGLILAAERYLAARGAKVIYAGGLFPLNPFYWGIYGGSEGSGILSGHARFHRAVIDMEYEPVSTTVLLEADLGACEPREPRAALIRRQTQLEFLDDAMPNHWWEGLALGEFQVMKARLLARSNGAELAHAETWDMSWFGRGDGRARVGLINLEVAAEHRRKGFARYLVSEIFRRARENLVSLVEVQTAETNQAAISLYAKLGFQPIDQATLYRLPAHRMERTRLP
jgi:ribosomal protein S18 acetylase RimI-like enzyme